MKKRGDVAWEIILVVAGVAVGLCLTISIIGWLDPIGCWQEEAVKAGHAEYYLDKDFQRQWRWLPADDGPWGGTPMEDHERGERYEGHR